MTERTTRRSRFVRAPLPGVISLQKRDKQILVSCYQYRFLLRSQIQKLFNFACVTRANIRLRKLFDHGYLDREFLPTDRGGSEAIYTLGRHGISIVSDELGTDEHLISKQRNRGHSNSYLYLMHDVVVNNTRINLNKEIRDNPRFALIKWQNASESECRYGQSLGQSTTRKSLKPDGFFQVTYDGKIYSFFVEIDLSTSGHRKIDEKFRAYADFKELQVAEARFGISIFNVLVFAKSPDRRDNLKLLADKIAPGMFWFASIEESGLQPLTAECWHRSGESSGRALFVQRVKVLTR